jgi:hypothetical protein
VFLTKRHDGTFRLLTFVMAALLTLPVAGCLNGKKEADPICVFVFSGVTNPTVTAAGTVALLYNASLSSDQTAAFDLVIYGPLTADLYGVAFKLSYDSTALFYTSTGLEDLLSSGSTVSLALRARALENGPLVFGLTRLDPNSGGVTLSSGANVIGTLYFTAAGKGITDLSFISGSTMLADPSGADIGGDWSSITETVTVRECF